MADGRTGGWLLAAETISAEQTTRPPEITIDITSEEIRPYQPKHNPCYERFDIYESYAYILESHIQLPSYSKHSRRSTSTQWRLHV